MFQNNFSIFTIYTNPSDRDEIENTEVVPEGFSWLAFIFPIIFLLYKKCWILAISWLALTTFAQYIILEVELNKLPYTIILFNAVTFLARILLGFHIYDYIRFKLERKGYILQDIIAEDNRNRALQRYFDRNLA